jgi:phage terminase large subunit-like protein
MTSVSHKAREHARANQAVAERRRRSSKTSTRSGNNAIPLDPVTQYATDVDSGRIVAGRYVRLACRRHLDDLERRHNGADFPYVFKPELAEDVFEFFRTFLTLDEPNEESDAAPFEMLQWLKFCFGSLAAWVHVIDGTLRFQQSYLETAKGSCKTPTAAGYGLFRLVGLNRRSTENYSLGVNGDQANYLYQFAKRMAERSDDLHDLLDVGEYNLAWVARNSFFRPLTSEGRSLDNKRIFTAIIEELHEHPTATIPEKMRLGIKGQVDAQIIELTNSGDDKTSVCWAHHEYSAQVLERTVIDEQWFAYVCTLDPCDACLKKGMTTPDDGCAQCDSWTDERVWPKVNPAILELKSLVGYTRGIVKQALNQPSMLARVKRLNFCIWTQAHTIWIPGEQWHACKRVIPDPPVTGIPCACMFDMSMKIDLASCVFAQRIDDATDAEPASVIIADNEDGQSIQKTWSVNYRVRLYPYFWLPEAMFEQRIKNERLPLKLWRDMGQLRVTKGPVIDHHQIADEFKSELAPKFKPQRVGYDPYNATEFAVGLRDRGKFTIVEVPQGRRMSEYIKLFHALVLLGRVEHDGNYTLAWCIANAEPKTDRFENVWLEKSAATKRIDGAIASVGAMQIVSALKKPRRNIVGGLIWTPNGWVQENDASIQAVED